jgi:hypothetical protein
MQSVLSPAEERISLLEFCRRLCAAETAAFEAAKVAISPPAQARRPRPDVVTDDVFHDDDYDLPSETSERRRLEYQREMKVQVDIAEACLLTIVDEVTKAARASACAIFRKGALLPPTFFAQAEGQSLLNGEIRAELYGEWQFSWRRGRMVRKATPYSFQKGNVLVVLAVAVDPTAQEQMSGGARNHDATPNSNSPDTVAPSTTSRAHLQNSFLAWYEKQPVEVQRLGPKALAGMFTDATLISIDEKTVRRALKGSSGGPKRT